MPEYRVQSARVLISHRKHSWLQFRVTFMFGADEIHVQCGRFLIGEYISKDTGGGSVSAFVVFATLGAINV